MLTHKMIPALVALVTALLLLILTLILPKQTYSEKQNKSLSSFPNVTASTMTNQSYPLSFEQYLSDHFIGRENCITLNNRLRLAMGNDEINDVFVKEDRLIENIRYYDIVTAEKNIASVQQFVSSRLTPPTYYFSLIPSASELYKEDLPSNNTWLNQSDFIRQSYEQLRESSTVIDLSSVLELQKNSNIFYNTDSRWTTYGAFLAYSGLIKSFGLTPASKDMFSIEHAAHNYYGNLYNKTLIQTSPADVIDLYTYLEGNVVENVKKQNADHMVMQPSLYDRDYLDSSQKLKVFLGESSPITTISTTVDNGQRLLLFKDSYSDPLVQFLTLHFDQITLVDLKQLTEETAQQIHISDYSSVLFLYSVSNFVSDNSIAAKLSFIQ